MIDDEQPVSDWSSLCAQIQADHEPPPRVNYVLRSLIAAPGSARGWLEAEKLPAIAQRATGRIYAETSHLFCKGLIEPLLDIGLRPRFVILRRAPRETALSLYGLGVVPHRSESGRLVLLSPEDPGVLPYPGWTEASDYQLCYWYALEIQRRQADYSRRFADEGVSFHACDMADLLHWGRFQALADFVGSDQADRPTFERIIGVNANPRDGLLQGGRERDPPPDINEQERRVEAAVAGG